jgi:MOSC domain-containing protein
VGRNTGAGAGVQAGIVTGLRRYPVKSMAGEALTSTVLSWAGIAGDRRWAFLRPGSGTSGFPWHTIRENPAMWAYVPRLLEPGRPDTSAVDVRAPGGRTYRMTDPGLADELGAGVRVMRLERGTFDAMPVSLITTSTVSALCALAGVPGSELRFRPNLVIAPASGAPYPEDDWVGCSLRIGGAVIRVDRRDTRCVIVDVNPGTGQPDAPVLKAAGRHHGASAGVYGTTIQPGPVRVGDPVTIIAGA